MIKKKTPKHTLESRGIFVRGKRTEEQVDKDTDDEFYSEVWNEREHKCFETNNPLTEEPLTLYFHHILPKAKYPQYRHEKWNIVILHPDVHSQVEALIDKCPRVKALTEHLKLVYG